MFFKDPFGCWEKNLLEGERRGSLELSTAGSSWRQEAHGEEREKEGIQKEVEQRWRSEKEDIIAGAQHKSPRGFLPPVVYVPWSEAAYSMPQRPISTRRDMCQLLFQTLPTGESRKCAVLSFLHKE